MIREAGDSALLLELDPVIDPEVNARAVAIAAALRRHQFPGVRDIVSTFRSVAVFFDPWRADVAALAEAIGRASGAAPIIEERAPIDVEVVYGGENGPDLAEVAAFAGCAPSDVIDRHASRTYRVFMLGFLPGFAYMGSVDDSIAAPRRATPRTRVPAGSVGIAGRQTGIYPVDSPGGWQIIGRTAMKVFDPDRNPPALFAPGDRVRFVPASSYVVADSSRTDKAVRLKADTTYDRARSVTVLRPGLLTTIQDEGRWGYQDLGVPVSGPMDPVSHRLANAIVGNPRDAATLEATLLGPELRVEQQTMAAFTGADLGATLDGAEVPRHEPIDCRPGSVIRFGPRRAGARAYVAFDGGVATPQALGSRATHALSALGGVEGRALRAGDRLPLGESSGAPSKGAQRAKSSWPLPEGGGARLRVLAGPQEACFTSEAFAVLQATRFTISTQSDRMGYRLSSDRPVPCAATGQMISDVTFVGGLQVPPSGNPILLMADRQTTGGYPQIATVITADLPAAGQLAPGDWVEFELCTRADALAALVAQEGRLLAFV
ncbi:MAG: 5-oxoprolinase subunit PxpB [Acidobacteria bacterium]|nr:5-oxoprolinase subunit PxpB [Acidobacteriota bacterium]